MRWFAHWVRPRVRRGSYACGGWVENTTIPADKPLIARSFDGAARVVHEKLRAIYETAYEADSPFRPLADFYSSCMNTTRLDELGAGPLAPMLDRIDRVSSAKEVGSIIADFIASDVPSPVKLQVASAGGADKVLFVNGGGFILPEASFYRLPHLQHERVFTLPPDLHTEERQNLENYYYQLNVLAGYSHGEAMHAANATIGLETVMAHWTLEEPPIHEVVWEGRVPALAHATMRSHSVFLFRLAHARATMRSHSLVLSPSCGL
jgi:predicted metalloendopeptidase